MGVSKEQAKQALDKLFGDMAGAMAAGMAYVGVRTGLFKSMTNRGSLTADQVVEIS